MYKTTILLDMDGVLANFHQGVFNLFKADMADLKLKPPYEYAIHKWLGISEDQLWNAINHASYKNSFWKKLHPFEWYFSLYAECRKHSDNIIISSSPGNHFGAWGQKIQWMNQWIPQHSTSNIMLGRNKHLMAKPGHVLIDDCEENCIDFITAGGQAILFPQLWNANHDLQSVHDKMRYVSTLLEGYCEPFVPVAQETPNDKKLLNRGSRSKDRSF